MEAYMQYMHSVHATPHITFLKQITSCLSFAAPYVWQMHAQSHVPWERSAKWMAKCIQSNFEDKMQMIWT